MSENVPQPQDKYVVRLPDGMRDRIKAAAESNNRSMNAEIVARLEQSIKGWPRISLPDELFGRVRHASADVRADLEAKITDAAILAVELALPSVPNLHKDLVVTFYRILSEAPEKERERLRSEFDRLSIELATAIDPRTPK